VETIIGNSFGGSMPLTLRDVMSKIQQLDEITVLEILEITSEELVERFVDKVEERYEHLEKELND
jgi:hypothetical protein